MRLHDDQRLASTFIEWRHGRTWVVFNRNARSRAATRRQRHYPFERHLG
jgi:hypothetical protein